MWTVAPMALFPNLRARKLESHLNGRRVCVRCTSSLIAPLEPHVKWMHFRPSCSQNESGRLCRNPPVQLDSQPQVSCQKARKFSGAVGDKRALQDKQNVASVQLPGLHAPQLCLMAGYEAHPTGRNPGKQRSFSRSQYTRAHSHTNTPKT